MSQPFSHLALLPVPGSHPSRAAGHELVVLFTRFPQPGRAKTRLIPSLGNEGAARLHDEMTRHCVAAIQGAVQGVGRRFEIRRDGGTARAMRDWLGRGFHYRPQGDGDLGRRLHRAATEAHDAGANAIVMIGSDCPGLGNATVNEAFSLLARHDIVLGPAADGGYYLIGLRQPWRTLFEHIAWGTGTVLAETLAAAQKAGLGVALLAEQRDVDEPADLPVWESARRAARTISVIIPALNESGQIEATLRTVRSEEAHLSEIIVADGGSRDATADLARRLGARVVTGSPSRGRQMNAGAAVATGQILLFLHADTELPPAWATAIHEGLSKPDRVGGAFSFSVREPFPGRRCVEWTTNLRTSLGRMPYGDQGIFVRRWAFERLQGFPDQPLMEDYEFVRRLRRLGPLATLSAAVRTSGRRWLRMGAVRVTLINALMVLGYRAGLSPARLATIYRRSWPFRRKQDPSEFSDRL